MIWSNGFSPSTRLHGRTRRSFSQSPGSTAWRRPSLDPILGLKSLEFQAMLYSAPNMTSRPHEWRPVHSRTRLCDRPNIVTLSPRIPRHTLPVAQSSFWLQDREGKWKCSFCVDTSEQSILSWKRAVIHGVRAQSRSGSSSPVCPGIWESERQNKS